MRAISKRFLVLAAALALALGLFRAPAFAEEFSIGEGDLLRITVYDNPDLATEARVGADGKISFPLIGEVLVGGMTAIQAQQRIAKMLQDGFVKKPQVSVFIKEYKSKKVTALGEFVKPGLIELRGNSTLVEVISEAGGVTPNAGETLMIKRMVLKPGAIRGEDQTVTVPLAALLEGQAVGESVLVLDGDSIYVPRAAFVYVSGAVKTPGMFKITPGLTVLKSITLAGGFTQRAAKSKVMLIRKSGSEEATYSAKMDDLVLPDDVVSVPESLF